MAGLNITLEFNGGAELLVNKVKKHSICLPRSSDEEVWTIRKLISWICDNLLAERPELFRQGETIRPGILVLVNDADWELMGELDYNIEENDQIVFISTLHGG